MNNYMANHHTYPAGRTSGSRRLSGSLSSNWISVREGRSSDMGTDSETDDIPVCSPEKKLTAETETVCAPVVQTAAEEVASEESVTATETAGEEAVPAAELAVRPPGVISTPSAAGLGAYGCAYHQGRQRLVVAHPGDAVPVHFNAHSCLNRIGHSEGDDHVVAEHAGDYDISFELRVTAKSSAPVTLELRAGDKTLPGGMFVYLLSSGTRECRGTVMARLQAGDHVSLMLASVSVCEASLAAGGVSAMLSLKKLN